MDLGLTGKRAFVGGASAGLGKACAAGLLAEGAHVVLCARGPEKLEATRAELAEAHPGRVHAVLADLAIATETARAVAEGARLAGGLDILITNTGGPPPGPFVAHDDAAWRAATDLLLLSVVNLVRAALPHLRASSQPRIVHIASTSVLRPIDGLLLSNALRGAVVGLARTLASELAPDILVNTVCPGLFDTDRIRQLGVSPARIAQIPLQRIGRPEEMAALVVFLASARASYLTGTVIPADGGVLSH